MKNVNLARVKGKDNWNSITIEDIVEALSTWHTTSQLRIISKKEVFREISIIDRFVNYTQRFRGLVSVGAVGVAAPTDFQED